MKNLLLLFLNILFLSHLHGQYVPFFNDEFDSNTNNWFVGEIKKSTVQFYNGSYCVYSDWGKSPIVSLIDLPFDEKKNYRIKSHMTAGYIPPYGNGKYGVMFAAKDEKNGYAALLDRGGQWSLVKIENGKIKELISAPSGNSKGGEINIVLENWFWTFKVDDETLYSCLPLPWMGHKAGLYCSEESGYCASNLTIEEATSVSVPCPLPFTQEQLNVELSKIICAAPDDFAMLLGNQEPDNGNYFIWNPQDVSLSGTKQVFIAKTKDGSGEKKGKDFIIMFACSDSKDEAILGTFFDRLRKAINEVKPPCGTLRQREVKENLADFLLKSVIWDIDIKTSSGNVKGIVELDFNKFETGYYMNIHVNVPK